jgi:hypothetical protein
MGNDADEDLHDSRGFFDLSDSFHLCDSPEEAESLHREKQEDDAWNAWLAAQSSQGGVEDATQMGRKVGPRVLTLLPQETITEPLAWFGWSRNLSTACARHGGQSWEPCRWQEWVRTAIIKHTRGTSLFLRPVYHMLELERLLEENTLDQTGSESFGLFSRPVPDHMAYCHCVEAWGLFQTRDELESALIAAERVFDRRKIKRTHS